MADFDSMMAQFTAGNADNGSQNLQDDPRKFFTNAELAATMQDISKAPTFRYNPATGVTVPVTSDMPAEKKSGVAATAAQKKAAMGGGILPSFDQAYQTSVGGSSNKGANTMSEVEQDIRTLRPIQLRAKYGDKQAAALMGQANLANQAVLLDNATTRSDGQVARDTAVDIASGFVMPALNIGAMQVGMFYDNAGVIASQGLEKLNGFIRNDLQSDELGQRRRLNEARNALDSRDSKAQHEIDLSNGDSELVAGLSRFGRGVVNSVSNATDDSAILGSGIANGIGSLFSGSVMAKGVSMAGKGALNALGKNGVIKSGGPINTGLTGKELGSLVDKAAFPATIGMMEGSSVYQQTVADSYARLIADGVPHDAAVEKATDAGTAAFAMTFPAAVGLSKLVQGFEAAPFARTSVRQSASNAIRETIEEGGQSGAGRLAQNLATKAYVDPKQDWGDQVGEQAGEGGLYGMGTSMAISAPSMAGNTVADTSKYLWGKASGAMTDAAAKLEAKNEAASPLAPNKVAAEVAATQGTMPETAAAIQAGIDTSSLNQEEKTEGQTYATTLTNSLVYGEAESAHLANHPIGAIVAGSRDKAEAMMKLAKFVNENGDAEQGTAAFDAAQELNNYVLDLEEALRTEPTSLSKLPDDHPAVVQMNAIKDTLAKVNAQPIVKKALAKADAIAVAFNASNAAAQITAESLATPEGQQFAQTAANVIAHDPAKANPALVNAVLAHAASGKLVLTPKQQKGIDVAKTLFDVSREDFANRERLGLKTQDIVSNQIQSAEYLAQGQESAVQHATRVYNAYRANDLNAANWHLEDFRKFAESIQNKLAALNEHLNNRQGRKSLNYQTIDQTTREWKTSTDPVGVTPTNVKSVEFMQDVAADAKMLVAVYENLKQTFPELNGQELKAVAVDSRIDKPAAEVVAAFKTGVGNVSSNGGIDNTSAERVKSLLKNIQVGSDKAKALLEKPTVEDSVKLKNVIEWANKKIAAIDELMAGSVSEADSAALSAALKDMNSLVAEATNAVNPTTSTKTEPTEEELDQLQNMGFTPVEGEELTWGRGDVDVEFSPELEDYSASWDVYDLQDGAPTDESGDVAALHFDTWNAAADFIESIPTLNGIRRNIETVEKSLNTAGKPEDVELRRQSNEKYFKKTLEKLNGFIKVFEEHNTGGMPNDVKPLHDLVKNIETLLSKLGVEQVGEESSVDLSTATPEQKKEVRQLLKLIRETTRAEKKAVRENPASLWNALKHSMTEWDLNNIFADWRKNRTFLKGKPGVKLSTLVASGQLDEFLPYDLRFGLVQQVDNGYRAPDLDTAVEFIQQSLVAGDYLTEDTRLLLGQIGTSLQELEQALNVEDLQNALEQVEAELAKQKTNREARRNAKAAATTSQTTTGSDPGTAVPQAPQGSVAPAVTPETPAAPINIYYGSNENAELSNLAARLFTFNARNYLSVGHAYQSNKGGVFDEATFKKYTKAGVKIVGTKGTKTTDGYNLKLMKSLIKASFDQNPDAAKALLATGNAQLTHTQDKGVWAKEFPRILMEVRTALAAKPAAEPKKKAEPAATSTTGSRKQPTELSVQPLTLPAAFTGKLTADYIRENLFDSQYPVVTTGKGNNQHDALWFGSVPYSYSGRNHPALAMPTVLQRLGSIVAKELGLPDGFFNSVHINRYTGSKGLGAHSDNEAIFQDAAGHTGPIATYSIGSAADISITRYGKVVDTIKATDGSLYVMPDALNSEGFQKVYRHSVGPSNGERISFTFRHIPASNIPVTLATSTPAVAEPIASAVVSSLVPMTDITNHTGGAYGADTLWDVIGRTFGVTKHNHYRESGNQNLSTRLKKSGVKAVTITQDQLEMGYKALEKIYKRAFPRNLQNNLKARNYFQVSNADAVYAIAELKVDGKSVMGGTDAAVQMAIAAGKPVNVWDLKTQQWHKWSGKSFEISETPRLTANFAGIGSRDIENYNTFNKDTQAWEPRAAYRGSALEAAATQAIKDVYEKTQKGGVLSNAPVEPAVSSSLVQEEEADTIEEEDDSDVTPFVYTGEATGLRDVPEFANLFGGAANRFLDAYKQPAEATSRMALADNILIPPAGAKQSGMEVILRSGDSLEEFMDAAPKVGYTSTVAKAYREYLGQFAGTAVAKLKSNLQAWLAYAPQKGDNAGVTNLQRFLKPDFVNTWENGKILNLLQNNNAKLTYDNKLLEGAVLAGLQWLITSESTSSRLKDKDVASIFSIELDEVPAGKAAEMSIGQGETNAVTALASKIQEYWGLESNKDYPLNQVTGITGSMAANILAAFKDIGLLSIETFNWEKPPTVINGKLTRQIKSHNRVIINLADQVNPDSFKALQSYPDAIEQAVMVKPEQTVYLEDERPDVARTQMRNPGAKNKKQALRAIEVNQDTAYKFTHQYKLYEALAANGYDKLMQLFGFGVLTQDDRANKFNKNHLVAVDGKNQSIVSAINGMNYLNEQVKARAEAVGKTPEEVEVHFAHAPSKVQRLQQIGRVTPQGDKNMRAVLSPHEAVLDLDDTRRKDYKNFLIAIAQAVGIKIHNIKPEIVIPQIQKLLDNELKPAVDVLQNWSKNMDRPIQDNAADIFLQSFKDARMDFSNLALQSLTEYALYLNAERGKGRSAFPVTLYGEADGITNGPGGARILHSTGPFTVHELQMFRKIGYYPGQKGWTAQDQFAVDDVDTYGTIAELLNTAIPALRDTYEVTSKPAAGQVTHLLNMLDLLFEGNLKYDTESKVLTIKRGAAKSPVTVTIYGAGQQGIASKIAGIVADELYEIMSVVASATYADPTTDGQTVMFGSIEKYNKFMAAFDALTNNYVGFNEKDNKHFLGKSPSNAVRNVSSWHQYAVDFTITPKEMENLTGNIKRIFVEPMDTAIRETMGESLMNSMTLIRQATQVQTIFLEDAFQTEVKRALAKKEKEDPNFQKGDFLSENELKKILDKLKYMMPKIDNGTQEYYLAGSSAAEVGDVKPFGMSLDGKFKTPAMVYGPKDLGVGGIAALNIGMVDGQMIMNFYWDGEVVGTMPVFDGIDLSLDKLAEHSEKANKAIFDAWMGNAMKALSESYSVFMQDTDISGQLRNPALFEKLAKALYGQRVNLEMVSNEKLTKDLGIIDYNLLSASLWVESRHRAMKRIGAGIDQMAGFSSPHWHEGDVSVAGMSDEQIAETLNKLVEEEYPGVSKDLRKTEDISEAVSNSGLHDIATGAKVFYQQNLSFLGSQMNIPQEQRWMYNELVNSKALEGWTFITGTNEQIRAKAEQLGVAAEHLNNLEKGLTLTADKIIMFPNATSETLVHEMVHAATFSIIHAHYSGTLPGKGNADIAVAVGGLEILMRQFMELGEELPVLSTETMQQYLHARSVIMNHLNQGKNPLAQASALNEFMAYTQSNPALIRMTKNTKASPLVRISKMVLEFIKELVWGKRAPRVGGDMFTNIRFNTALLARYQPSVGQTAAAANAALAHTAAAVGNPRLQELRDYFLKQIPDHLTTPVDRNNFGTAAANIHARSVAAQAAITAAQHGFRMDHLENSTFTTIVHSLATQAAIDPNSMARAQELFALATKKLEISDFIDPSNSDAASALYYAKEQYELVMGEYSQGTDKLGRSTLLPVFLGLAMVNNHFRDVLSKLELPKSKLKEWNTADNAFENLGKMGLDALSLRLTGEGKHTPNVQAALDALTNHLMDTAQDDLSLAEQTMGKIGTKVGAVNDWVVSNIGKVSSVTTKWAKSVIADSTRGKYKKALAYAAEITAGIVNEETANGVAEGITSVMNRLDGFKTLREMLSDIVGRTENTAELYDANKVVRSMVSQDRQHYRDGLPEIIRSKFSREVTEVEMTAMFHGLGKSDIAVLRETMKDSEIRELFTKASALPMAIRAVETQLKTADPKHWNQIEKKAMQLAGFMNGKGAGTNLLRNAEAVSGLFMEKVDPKRVKPDAAFIKAVDKLITLYFLDNMADVHRNNLSSLVQSEAEGVDFVMAYLNGQREEEMRKAQASLTARENYFKGYVPSEQDGGVSLIVVNDSEFSKLALKSFTKVESYKGSSLIGGEPKSYYFAKVPGRAPYNQGTMQNVRQTAGGIDLATGFTDGMMMAGRITDPRLVYKLAQNMANERATNEPLMPIYSNGVVVAFERAVDPLQLERLNQNTDLAKMIGVWRGRQVEEAKVQVFNEALVDAAKRMHKADVQAGRGGEYINVFDPKEQKKDPVLADAVRLLNPETLEYLESVFGVGKFPVRKDMLNDMLGYRNATVGDMWTGNHRWSPETENAVKNMAISIYGNKAYQYFVNSEKLTQNVMNSVKTNIIIKSIVIPTANLIGNAYQLLSRGIPHLFIWRQLPRKAMEVHAYAKSRRREIEAEAELRAAAGDAVATRRLTTEIQSIKDSHARMSIWPLIQAGQFSAISDMGISREDQNLTSGKLHDWIEGLVGKLPTSIRNAGRYAVISKDTALFRGLQMAVDYGDFIAKAVLYDHLTQQKEMTSAEALARISEEFVNYDKLPGRTRGYLENMGLLWFYNFKLRLVKIALSTIRNNPVHALMVGMAPKPTFFGSIGTPISDNFLTMGVNGELGNSVGLGMALNAPTLNPVINAFY